MSSKFTNDLTQGSVAKQLIKFSWPFLLSMFIQSIYGSADMMIAGWFMGAKGIAAVQNGSQITLVVTNIIIGFSVGGTVLIAQYLGAKQMENVKETIGTLFTVFTIAAVAVTIIMLMFSRTALQLLNTSDVSFDNALSYLNICMSGTIFIVGYNLISAVLRAMGDSKRPLVFVSIACVINIVLDILFVGPLKMQAAGAALATVIAQAISFFLAVIYLVRNNFIFDFKLKSFKIHKDKFKLLIKIGIPSTAQQTLVSFSFLTLTSLSNQVAGTIGGAVVGIGGKINNFGILPGIAMASSISSMTGQNLGAGNTERAAKTLKVGMLITFSLVSVLFVLTQLFPDALVRMFLPNSQGLSASQMNELIDSASMYIRLLSFDSLILSIGFCFNGLINGSGRTMLTMLTSLISSIFLRIPLAYILAIGFNLGMLGVGISIAVSPLSTLIVGFSYYKSGKWKTPKIIKHDSASNVIA